MGAGGGQWGGSGRGAVGGGDTIGACKGVGAPSHVFVSMVQLC